MMGRRTCARQWPIGRGRSTPERRSSARDAPGARAACRDPLRRPRRSTSAIVACLAISVAIAVGARAQPSEPPPEAQDGADYVAEPQDSLDDGCVEVSVGASGAPGQGSRRTRRVRFSGDSLGGSVRAGDGDPLAGGSVEGRLGHGAFGVGRLAPRWGRGLILGAAADPWSFSASDRGAGSDFRGRAGDGAWYRDSGSRAEVFHGRFGGRNLTGAAIDRGAMAAGMVVADRGAAQASVWLPQARRGLELAMDRRGRWRAEGTLERSFGRLAVAGRVRGGLAGFRSLAEPRRSGPAHALALSAASTLGAYRLGAIAALWRFGPGVTGTRASLAVVRSWSGGGVLTVGVEEQHGVRAAPSAATISSPGRLRQGWWAEWRGATPSLGLGLRHEAWGTGAFARGPVRVVTTAAVDARGPGGVMLRVLHTVYRAGHGESLYVPERETDRLVLRSLSGAGERTRCVLRVPAAGGSMSAGMSLTAPALARARSQWTIDWTRRARTHRPR